MEKIKVLLFAANPRGTASLDLPRECREIEDEIRIGEYRDALEVVVVLGARPVDLLRRLNEVRPHIVHFSGHGSSDAEILLEGGSGPAASLDALGTRSADDRDMSRVPASQQTGNPKVLSKPALVDIVSSCDEGNIRVVLLSACHTRPQAEALANAIDCVVSMNRAISDHSAIMFAASFYGALAFGRSVAKAFDQGVARLRAEGCDDADIPELIVRASVDAAKVVLVGRPAEEVSVDGPEAPFTVPFPRNPDFVGRDGDLINLHQSLADAGTLGIRPAGLTGMGGIGKTQLAIEYAYRYRDGYPGGVFWINAAEPLVEGFAALGRRLRPAVVDRPRDDQIQAAFEALVGRADSLLVLDNLADPSELIRPLATGWAVSALRCRVVFTTRRRNLGRFAAIEVTVLPEEPALRLLLRHPARQAIRETAHPEQVQARVICRMLGRLPLALELAGAFLGEWVEIRLTDYRDRLKREGILATLDDEAVELAPADLPAIHDAAVTVTLRSQWEALRDETARQLLRIAGQFPEAAAIPAARLGLLAGVPDRDRPGSPASLARALRRLEDACLIEEMIADQLRLHPLVREFAIRQLLPSEIGVLRRGCAQRVADSFERYVTLEDHARRRGINAIQEDLILALDLCPPDADDLHARLRRLLRVLQREAHNLRGWDPSTQPALFAQQIHNRAVALGLEILQAEARQALSAARQPHAMLNWRASCESPLMVRTLNTADAWVIAIAMAPDGRHAVLGTVDQTLTVWDLRTGQLLRTSAGHKGRVNALTVAPDGLSIISASTDRTLKIWEFSTGREVRTLTGHEGPVNAVAITPDGIHAVSVAGDRTIRLWELQTGKELLAIFHPGGWENTVAVTPDGRFLLAATADGALKIWDLRTRQDVRSILGHARPVLALAVTPDSRHVLSASGRTLKLWDLRSSQEVRSLVGHGGSVRAVAVTPEGRHALSASDDRTLKLWDLMTGEVCCTITGHGSPVTAVALSPDGRHALSVALDRVPILWDLRAPIDHPGVFKGHETEVMSVVALPDGHHALSASADGALKIWGIPGGRLERSLSVQQNRRDDRAMARLLAVAVTIDGRYAICALEDRSLRIWDLETDRERRKLKGHRDRVTSVAVTPDGRQVLSGSSDCSLKLWDLESGRELRALLGHTGSVFSIAVTPDGRRVLSASSDRSVRSWDLQTGHELHRFHAHIKGVLSVAVTPDGRHSLSGSMDHMLIYWDLQTGQKLCTLCRHGARVWALCIDSTGRYALSASHDRTFMLWDLSTRSCLLAVPLDSAPTSIAIAPDNEHVVIGDLAGDVHCLRMVIPS
jgi:WD40 repeat protein